MKASQRPPVVKNPPANAAEMRRGSVSWSGRSAAGEYGNPLQYSCLGNPTDRETWLAIVHRVIKSQTGLKRLSMHDELKPNL